MAKSGATTTQVKKIETGNVRQPAPRATNTLEIEAQPVLAAAPDSIALAYALQRATTDPAGLPPSDINLLQHTIGMRATRRLASDAIRQGNAQPAMSRRIDPRDSLQRMLTNRGIQPAGGISLRRSADIVQRFTDPSGF